MLAGIEFGLLHLFPHRVNAFKDMVYFSNGETLFSETFIRLLPVPLTSLSKKIGLYVRLGGEMTWESLFFLGGSLTQSCCGFPGREASYISSHLQLCPAWRGATEKSGPLAGCYSPHTHLGIQTQGTAGLCPGHQSEIWKQKPNLVSGLASLSKSSLLTSQSCIDATVGLK